MHTTIDKKDLLNSRWSIIYRAVDQDCVHNFIKQCIKQFNIFPQDLDSIISIVGESIDLYITVNKNGDILKIK